jgi:hypothetical protein
MKKFSFFILLVFFISFITPVYATPIDTSIEVVSRGIEQFVEYRSEKILEENYGISYGNTSESENLTPSQKLVFMIAAADQNPYLVKEVRDTLASDLVWFGIILVGVSIYMFVLTLLQKHAPSVIATLDKRFIGHEEIHDYTVWLEVLLTLVVFVIICLPTIETIIELEQNLSVGLTLKGLEYLKLTSSAPDVYFWEAQAYGICARFFLWRIEYINWFAANILKIIILYGVALFYSKYIAELFAAWFLSCLLMRPVVLYISAKALQDIAATYPQTDSMWGNLAGFVDIYGVTYQNMIGVTILSAIICFVAIFGPIIIMIIKIFWDYLFSIAYKLKILLGL